MCAPLAAAEIHPQIHQHAQQKRSISPCVKIRDRKVFTYILHVGAFWLSLETSSVPSIHFLLSCLPHFPLLSPASPSPLPAPDEFLLLPGRLFCGWRDWPWQLHKSRGGATWVPSRPLTHCRGQPHPFWGAELIQFELQASFHLFSVHFWVLGFRGRTL